MDLDGDGKVSKWEYFPYWFDRLRVFPDYLFLNIHLHVLSTNNVVHGIRRS